MSDDEDEDVGFVPRSQHGVGQHAVQPSMTPAITYIPDAAEGVELSASPRSGSRGVSPRSRGASPNDFTKPFRPAPSAVALEKYCRAKAVRTSRVE